MADVAFIDWLVTRFYRAGTRRIFGVPGGGTSLDLIHAAERCGMELVLTAREDAAVMMAGAAAILSDAPGIAFCTKGPGLASATNGLASAALDRMPVLLIAETFAPGEREYVTHQVFDQEALVAPLLRQRTEDILACDVDAIESWLSRVPLNCPALMFPTGESLRQRVPTENPSAPTRNSAIQPAPDADIVREIARRVQQSQSPVVVIGLDAARAGLEAQITDFVEACNALTLTTYMASGTVSTAHPNYAGIFTGGAIEQACVSKADLIVLVGLDPVELIRKPWTYQSPVIDICQSVHEIHYVVPEERLAGPLDHSLTAVCASLENGPTASTWTTASIEGQRDQHRLGLQIDKSHGLSSDSVVQIAATAFGRERRLSIDAGAHMFSASAFWPAKHPRDVLISNGLASMGFAIPAGIAAALDSPERGAVAMTGDGGILMCLGELKTVAETNANVCIIVFNDGRLSLIDIKREERQMPDLGLSWPPPDFAAIANGFGLRSWRPDTASALQAACDEAARHQGPSLIDVLLSSSGYFEQMKALRG